MSMGWGKKLLFGPSGTFGGMLKAQANNESWGETAARLRREQQNNAQPVACNACDAIDPTTGLGNGKCEQCHGEGYKNNSSIPGAYSSKCNVCNDGVCHVCGGNGIDPPLR